MSDTDTTLWVKCSICHLPICPDILSSKTQRVAEHEARCRENEQQKLTIESERKALLDRLDPTQGIARTSTADRWSAIVHHYIEIGWNREEPTHSIPPRPERDSDLRLDTMLNEALEVLAERDAESAARKQVESERDHWKGIAEQTLDERDSMVPEIQRLKRSVGDLARRLTGARDMIQGRRGFDHLNGVPIVRFSGTSDLMRLFEILDVTPLDLALGRIEADPAIREFVQGVGAR